VPGPSLGDNYRRIRDALPSGVALLVAAKGRTADEVAEVIRAGAKMVGHNLVQEAEQMRARLGAAGGAVEWHLIGHLQRNKVNRALPLFDVIQSVDSARLARALGERAGRPARVYVEVNVGGEESKSGASPEDAHRLVAEIAALPGICVEGLMTVEPYCEDADAARPFFRRMRSVFEEIKGRGLPNVRMDVLSMGMTHSYGVAVEEGANMVRIGTAIFGPRQGE
jgi:hypothetical protein